MFGGSSGWLSEGCLYLQGKAQALNKHELIAYENFTNRQIYAICVKHEHETDCQQIENRQVSR